MKRHDQYVDPNSNPFAASPMQHMYPQRMQHSAGMKIYSEHSDSFSADNERHYRSSKEEGHWLRDRDVHNASIHIPSHSMSEGHGGTGFFYKGQMLNEKLDSKKQENIEGRVQLHDEDMEVGYEENPSTVTFERLQQKFLDEISKLVKEQSEAEDAENSRHMEKMVEINTKYQEKLLSSQARQANARDEFLDKESQARFHQYQQAGMNHYTNNHDPDHIHSYSGAGDDLARETRRAYGNSHFDSFRDRPQYPGSGRASSNEGMIMYPSGRAYNTGTGTVYYPDIP